MQVQAKNLTEVIISLIALAGEIPKDLKIAGVTEAAVNNQINRLKKRSLIKHDVNHNRIRLKYPEGLNFLQSFSEDLYAHYMMVSNDHQFQTGDKASENYRQFSECVLFMLQCGYQIDNFAIEYKSNIFGKQQYESDELESIISGGLFDLGYDAFLKNGEIVPLEEAATLSMNKKFFTSKYLKKGFDRTSRLNISKATGMIVSNGSVYTVFFDKESGRINAPAERAMSTRIRNISRYVFDEEEFEEFSKEFPKAIIITKNMNSQLKKTSAFETIFKNSYVIPADENGEAMLELFSCENWQSKIQEGLYGKVSDNNIYDGVFDGRVSWEILSCEFRKLSFAAEHAGSSPVHFICFKWQEKIVKNMTKKLNATITTLTKEQEKVLFDLIKREEQ